jgi:hypothetical protein
VEGARGDEREIGDQRTELGGVLDAPFKRASVGWSTYTTGAPCAAA